MNVETELGLTTACFRRYFADSAVPVFSLTVDSRSGILHARHGHIVKSLGKCFMFLSLKFLPHRHTECNWYN